MKKILGLLVTAFMLTASALAADLDTPQIGAAVCAPEEADGSVVLHEAPDGRSETLMRYFQGAPLQVLDLADGWAHVRMGMEGDSLEGYIRQERLKYGAEAMREVAQYASMPGFEHDAVIYQACDEQSGIVEVVQGPCGIALMGYNGQWAAIWGRNGFIPSKGIEGIQKPSRMLSSYPVWPLDSEITAEEAEHIFREEVRQKRAEWGLCAEYDDETLLNEEIQWNCSLDYEPWRGEASYYVYMIDPTLFTERTSTVSALFARISTKGEIQKVYNWLPQSGTAVCAPAEESDTVTLYAEPNEDSDALFGYYSGVSVEVTEVTRAWAHVRVGGEEAALEGWMRTYDLAYTALKERDVPHVVRYARAGELAVYAAPSEDAKVLRKTKPNRGIDIIGMGSDGWAQLSWNIAKGRTAEAATGFVHLGDDAELGKPSRTENYFVHPVEGQLSFDEAEEKAREYVMSHGPTKDAEKWSKAWMRSRKGILGAACTVSMRYNSETGQTGFEIWLYQPGTEENEEGIAVEMTPQGEITDAGEGFG